MRQIDHMSEGEIEILRLKGMLPQNTTNNKHQQKTMTTKNIKLVKDKACKHSVRFAAVDRENSAVETVYISREVAAGWSVVNLTVEEARGVEQKPT